MCPAQSVERLRLVRHGQGAAAFKIEIAFPDQRALDAATGPAQGQRFATAVDHAVQRHIECECAVDDEHHRGRW